MDEVGSVSSEYVGGRLEVQGEIGFASKVEEEEILQGLRGIKCCVNVLAICVLLMFVVILMKWFNGLIIPSLLSCVLLACLIATRLKAKNRESQWMSLTLQK